ncbi:MAG TPA: hypothetical protein VND20_06525 [Candidatus Binataceae bacterium]|nr:hypothetical protein [Candidatus Binataceae bacterium]
MTKEQKRRRAAALLGIERRRKKERKEQRELRKREIEMAPIPSHDTREVYSRLSQRVRKDDDWWREQD